jgi:hypothetical protein
MSPSTLLDPGAPPATTPERGADAQLLWAVFLIHTGFFGVEPNLRTLSRDPHRPVLMASF